MTDLYLWPMIILGGLNIVFHLVLTIVECVRIIPHYINDTLIEYQGLLYRADKITADHHKEDAFFLPWMVGFGGCIVAAIWPLSIIIGSYYGFIYYKRKKNRLIKKLKEQLP